MISSIEGQCANNYTVEPSVLVIIFEYPLVYASLLCRIHWIHSIQKTNKITGVFWRQHSGGSLDIPGLPTPPPRTQ